MLKVLVLVAVLTVAPIRTSQADDPFSPENVKEVPCGEEYIPAPNTNASWVKERGNAMWYYKFGNRAHARIVSLVLTGKAPKGPDHFKHACLTIRRTARGFTQAGFKTQADFKCRVDTESGTPARTCSPDTESESTVVEWAAIRGTTEATIVWTDNCRHEIGFRCSGGTTVWSLRSTDTKDVDEATKKKVMDFIVSKGFHLDHVVEFPQEGCENDGQRGRSLQLPKNQARANESDTWAGLD